MSNEPSQTRIVPLGNLKSASEAPDIRDWDVFGSDGKRIGRVHDVLLDSFTSRILHLDVELAASLVSPYPPGDRAEAAEAARQAEQDPSGERRMTFENLVSQEPHVGERGDRHVLLPAGAAWMDMEEHRVLVHGLASADARALPVYEPAEVPVRRSA